MEIRDKIVKIIHARICPMNSNVDEVWAETNVLADAILAIEHPSKKIHYCEVMPDRWLIHKCHPDTCKHYHQNDAILEMSCRKTRPATIADLMEVLSER